MFDFSFFYKINSGGYNLYVDIPIQKEPEADYLFKFNGKVVKIPPLTPCRIHFGEWLSKINLSHLIQKNFLYWIYQQSIQMVKQFTLPVVKQYKMSKVLIFKIYFVLFCYSDYLMIFNGLISKH